jgi:hypothetical protein
MDKINSLSPRALDVENFLSADVGNGASGDRLTVDLVLLHLGIDPALEAEHLATLSRESAATKLTRSIESTPGSMWERSAAKNISRRLVRLLPVHLPIVGA